MKRRELLGGLGIASASAALWALGCGGPQRTTASVAEAATDREALRGWLREAVARLRGVFTGVHVLAVQRVRNLAASDVLGTGIGYARRDALVISVRDEAGRWHEQVTPDLGKAGIAAAVRALVGTSTRTAAVDFGPVPRAPEPPVSFGDGELRNRVEAITRKRVDSRVVYGVSLFDVEDTWVFSLAPGHDREQRSRRVRQTVLRAAWNGSRPAVGTAERGWIGALVDPRALGEADAERATASALELMTPAAFPDGRHTVLLDPSVTASLLEAGTRALLTTTAARRPEVRRSLAIGATVASPLLTLTDDPTTRGSYGGYEFDDEGTPAAPLTLIDRGTLTAVLGTGRGLRPGHVGPLDPAISHLALAPGTTSREALLDEGFVLEGGLTAVVDPGTTRVVIAASRARTVRAGKRTGHVYPDIELIGDLGPLFASVRAVSAEREVFDLRDEYEGEPRWRSIQAPWLEIPLGAPAQPGMLRARRRFG